MSKLHLIHQGSSQEIEFFQQENQFRILLNDSVNDSEIEGEILQWEPPHFKVSIKGKITQGTFYRGRDFVDIHLAQGNFRIQFPKKQRHGSGSELTEGDILAPMPGKVLKCLVQEGEEVKSGDCLMVIEAMKMEHKILAPVDGEVEQVFFKESDKVSQGDELLKIKE